jgi:hypothetical protein
MFPNPALPEPKRPTGVPATGFLTVAVREAKVHPDAILPDLSELDPLVRLRSKWKQRYFTNKGDD